MHGKTSVGFHYTTKAPKGECFAAYSPSPPCAIIKSMNSIAYLGKSFIDHILGFLRNWYVGSTRTYWYFVMNRLEALDKTLAWKITLKNLFSPLYKDYSLIGYVLGFIFRLGRLILGSIIYAVIISIAVALHLFWLFLPLSLIYMIFSG